jgi:hypothetical protein
MDKPIFEELQNIGNAEFEPDPHNRAAAYLAPPNPAGSGHDGHTGERYAA